MVETITWLVAIYTFIMVDYAQMFLMPLPMAFLLYTPMTESHEITHGVLFGWYTSGFL